MFPPVFRFAPSPNGYLHLGHALSALMNFEMARAAGGRFLLRIEDIDPTRRRSHFDSALREDLAWLGLTWEEPVRRQSEHRDAYRVALERLAGACLVYPTFESRSELARQAAACGPNWPRDPDGVPLYPRADRTLPEPERAARLAAGQQHAVRLMIDDAAARVGELSWTETGRGPNQETGTIAASPQIWGDVVLARKDAPASYHLAVVTDDAEQGITHVVRGQDLFWATSVHRLLQALLGLPAPIYHHHRLILDAQGRKLSKSNRTTALRELRSQGVTPADVRRLVHLS